MEPEFTVKTLHPIIHLTARSPRPQAPTPASLHLSPAHICTAVRTDRGSPRSAGQQKTGVVAAPPKRGSVSQLNHGNTCNPVLPLGSLTRALLMPQGLSTDYSRVMVNGASKDKEEACARQKSQPPRQGLRPRPSFSTVLYDSEQAICN